MQVTFHRFILAEMNTHRVFSRNYRSSRAVPVKKLLEEVRTNPAMPVYWGANRPGMQATGELSGAARAYAEKIWRQQAGLAADYAEILAETGLHKQIANRVLEPFLYVHGVITATEWDNFFGLRLHKDAQPEMRAIAQAMYVAREESVPKLLGPRQWHLPYISQQDFDIAEAEARFAKEVGKFLDPHDILIRQSVARCARVSYKVFDEDRPSTVAEDLALYQKLVGAQPMHASPAEHQATPDDFIRSFPARWAYPHLHGNFRGWVQYRKTLPGEACAPLPEAA